MVVMTFSNVYVKPGAAGTSVNPKPGKSGARTWYF